MTVCMRKWKTTGEHLRLLSMARKLRMLHII